ncbi:segregation and condensation protein A [Humitalea sp. 24SJ18S-53]|uniref:segregation and condensation protein A n=1 Tax=Humitalea sp. 24SJ18S-53 TaxID=3422307 RepID=UPI003D663D63
MTADPTMTVRLDGYEGPLDLLLDLARAQKVDLAKLSIVALVDQYLLVIADAHALRLELAADWLVMAAWLAWLKSRLLVPEIEADEDAVTPEALAGQLAERLLELERMRQAALWLNRQPQLGQEVWARGSPESFTVEDRNSISADLPALLAGYSAVLRRLAARRPYRPKPRRLWTVQEAVQRLAGLLGGMPSWAILSRFLPDGILDPFEQRAATASTLIASLELARDGRLDIRQEQAFGPIMLKLRENEASHAA